DRDVGEPAAARDRNAGDGRCAGALGSKERRLGDSERIRAAIHGLPDQDYLPGAWNKQTMKDLRGTYEEHDWSEILTGVYYDLLQYLYVRNLKEIPREDAQPVEEDLDLPADGGTRRGQGRCIRALFRAADQTANVMLRAIDYCPPVDLRYQEY